MATALDGCLPIGKEARKADEDAPHVGPDRIGAMLIGQSPTGKYAGSPSTLLKRRRARMINKSIWDDFDLNKAVQSHQPSGGRTLPSGKTTYSEKDPPQQSLDPPRTYPFGRDHRLTARPDANRNYSGPGTSWEGATKAPVGGTGAPKEYGPQIGRHESRSTDDASWDAAISAARKKDVLPADKKVRKEALGKRGKAPIELQHGKEKVLQSVLGPDRGRTSAQAKKLGVGRPEGEPEGRQEGLAKEKAAAARRAAKKSAFKG